MAIPLALPLAPVVSSGAGAAAATFVIGSTAKLAQSIYGFRRETPTLPPITGREGVATLQQMIADAWAGARLPVANPIPPPFNPGGLGLAAAAAAGLFELLGNRLKDLWGLLNGPERLSAPTPDPGIVYLPTVTASGTYSAAGSTRIDATYSYRTRSPTFTGTESDPSWDCSTYNPLRNTSGLGTTVNGLQSISWDVVLNHISGECNVSNKTTRLYAKGTSGLNQQVLGLATNDPIISNVNLTMVALDGPALDASSFVAVGDEVEAVMPVRPWTSPELLPAASATLPKLPKLITPLFPSQPAVPGAVPETGTANTSASGGTSGTPQRNRIATSAAAPYFPRLPAYSPPLIQPSPAEPITQTQPSGALVPVVAPPTVATSPNAIFPYPGAAPLPGNGPAPNLVEIAKELGRIESKQDRMLRSPTGPGGNLGDLLGPIANAIQSAIASLLDGAPGGLYEITGPCEVDAEGLPIAPAVPIQVPIPATSSNLDAVIVRIDALAQLVQHHKNLRQPICRRPPPTGDFVTVNFEEM